MNKENIKYIKILKVFNSGNSNYLYLLFYAFSTFYMVSYEACKMVRKKKTLKKFCLACKENSVHW